MEAGNFFFKKKEKAPIEIEAFLDSFSECKGGHVDSRRNESVEFANEVGTQSKSETLVVDATPFI
jgi:hypothetical protein